MIPRGLPRGSSFAHLNAAAILLLQGRVAEGLEMYQNLPASSEKVLSKIQGITLAYSLQGNAEKVAKGIQQLEAAMETEAMGRALTFLMLIHTMEGNHEVALDLLEQVVLHRLPMLVLLQKEPLLKPLRSNPRFQKLMQQVFGEAPSFNFPKRKYKKSPLRAADMEKYRSQLQQLMSKEKPYLNPNLTLRNLAQMIDLHPNHLSQLLNERLDKNFSEYVYTYRLETFKSKAADPIHQQWTILAVAYDCGFNSKTVFNTFFKKAMGKTPREYWKEVQKK